jgi:RNA polymerase sigma-70 factor (ECF subfamily)
MAVRPIINHRHRSMTAPNRDIDLTAWVRLYTKEMLSWAYHRTSDLQIAEDLVQDTFLVAAEKIGSFRGESEPKTWLFGILKNKISEYFKKRAQIQTHRIEDESMPKYFIGDTGHWKPSASPQAWNDEPEHLLDNEVFVDTLNRCLDQLPVQWRRCITMKFLEERKTEIVCQELGISPTNYWQILHRTKLQLRQCLERHWFHTKEDDRR